MAERDDRQVQLDGELARLAQATSDLAPEEGLAAAVMEEVARAVPSVHEGADPEAVLARAARATSGLEPAAGFAGAVMQAVATPARRAHIAEGVVRAGPLAVAFAAVAAAACLFLSFDVQSDLDDAIVAAVDPIEVVE